MAPKRKRSAKGKRQLRAAQVSRRKRRKAAVPNPLPSLGGDDDDEAEGSEGSASDADSEEYEVEAVLDEHANGSVLVKWVGYDKATWEPRNQIPAKMVNRYRKETKDKIRADLPDTTTSAAATTKGLVKPKCAVCGEEELSGRVCASCNKSVHHMCSNQVSVDLGVAEFGDTCFCSSDCYSRKMGSVISTSNDKQKRTTHSSKSDKNSIVNKDDRGPVTSSDSTTLIGGKVAFSPSSEDWMPAKLYAGVNSLYLVGVVSRQKKREWPTNA
jgi:hypothetical protein